MAQDNSKYTKPELRERIKNSVMQGSDGGKPEPRIFCVFY